VAERERTSPERLGATLLHPPDWKLTINDPDVDVVGRPVAIHVAVHATAAARATSHARQLNCSILNGDDTVAVDIPVAITSRLGECSTTAGRKDKHQNR